MAEWLRRQPAKLMGIARAGSNPAGREISVHGRVVKAMDLKSIGHCPRRFESY